LAPGALSLGIRPNYVQCLKCICNEGTLKTDPSCNLPARLCILIQFLSIRLDTNVDNVPTIIKNNDFRISTPLLYLV